MAQPPTEAVIFRTSVLTTSLCGRGVIGANILASLTNITLDFNDDRIRFGGAEQ